MTPLQPARTVLLLVDIQREYFAGGAVPLEGAAEAAGQAVKLLTHARYNHVRAIFVQHLSLKEGATSFVPGSAGVSLYASIRPLPGETIIRKHHPNAFRDTNLLSVLALDEVSRLIICGMMTHMCIDATVRAAHDNGFDCVVAADACATHDLTFGGKTIPAAAVQRAFLAALDGTFAKVMSVEEIVPLTQAS